ncbi:hypothetical protein [Shinella zoogloeoides]|nr:hypothetical protein [Shinella zoogloeoides]WLR90988.1 hypothetical protein Q9316_00130 [Shinella zoogloeoides]
MSTFLASILYALLIVWFYLSLKEFWHALIRAGVRRGWFRHDV